MTRTGRKKRNPDEKLYGPHRLTKKQLEWQRTPLWQMNTKAGRSLRYRMRSTQIPAGQDDYILGGAGLHGGHAGYGKEGW